MYLAGVDLREDPLLAPLRRLFETTFGFAPDGLEPLAGGGSRRRTLRVSGGGECRSVGVLGPDPHENRAFVGFAKSLGAAGLPVPRVLAEALDEGAYLVEDLGDETLYGLRDRERALTGNGQAPPEIVLSAYRRALSALVRFQVEGRAAVDLSLAHPRAAFDRQAMRWDLDSFKYLFLRLAHASFHEERLEADFVSLLDALDEAGDDALVYRDFNSRNVVLKEGEPWFVDFQGARSGAHEYDVASLLYDGRADLDEDTRGHLLEAYLEALGAVREVDAARFRERFPRFVVLRRLQAFGAYGYLGLYQRQPHFVRSIPPGLRSLAALLESGRAGLALPELTRVVTQLVERDDLGPTPAPPEGSRLCVRVRSFSYRQGVPEDPSGNGGGYVFDCRALSNPARVQTLVRQSGLDLAVQRWFEELGDAVAYSERAYAMVEPQVERYLERGFTSLCVDFGCTGGQHRSVFCAESLAQRLREQYGERVDVSVEHLERHRWPAEAGGG